MCVVFYFATGFLTAKHWHSNLIDLEQKKVAVCQTSAQDVTFLCCSELTPVAISASQSTKPVAEKPHTSVNIDYHLMFSAVHIQRVYSCLWLHLLS
jgi:hypothetical protein